MNTRFLVYFGLAILINGCAKPSYVGVKKELMEPKPLVQEVGIATNLQVHQRFINSLRLPSSVLDDLTKEQLVIVSNYSQYPFDGSRDSSQVGSSRYIDNFLLTEISVAFNKQLLAKGVKLLENDPDFNRSLLFNYDNASVYLNFEVLEYGIYYEQIAYDAVVRHISSSIRYRIVTNKGLLKSIEDKVYALSDTINIDDIPAIERNRPTLGYPDTHFAKRLTKVGAPSIANERIERVINFTQDSVVQTEKITALKFEIPNTEKQYVVYVLDYYAYDFLKSTKEPTLDNIKSLNPLTLPLAYSSYEKMVFQGAFKEVAVGYIQIDQISELFNKTTKVVVLDGAGRQMVIVRLGEEGMITVD